MAKEKAYPEDAHLKPKAPPQKQAPVAPRNTDPNFKYLVRLGNTDIDGNKQIMYAMRKVKGVSYAMAYALCQVTGIVKSQKAGYMKDVDVQKLETALKDPLHHGIPEWMVNRRKDFETGQVSHQLGGELEFAVETDIRRMKKNKSYKGLRHAWGQPVRGQRTKSNFRRNKGKGMGVKKKANASAGRV